MASSWNGAKTWEERDVSTWATSRLTELIKQCTHKDGGCSVTTKSVTSCAGDAVVRWIKGKKKIGYEIALSFKWEGEEEIADDDDHYFKGTMNFPDICEDCDD